MSSIFFHWYGSMPASKMLTGKIIRKLVKKIIVFKAEKVDGYRQQRIQMIYNAIGAVEIPNEKEAA